MINYNLIAGLEYRRPIPRLQLTLSKGTILLYSYHQVTHIECLPSGTVLTLATPNSQYLVKGEYLHRLMPYLQTESLPHLFCFNPEIHTLDEASPCVRTIANDY